MRISRRKCIFWSVAISLALLLTSCCACAHMAEHGCSYYDDCHTCRLFESVAKLVKLASLPLIACLIASFCLQAVLSTAQRCNSSATLVARFVQLND